MVPHSFPIFHGLDILNSVSVFNSIFILYNVLQPGSVQRFLRLKQECPCILDSKTTRNAIYALLRAPHRRKYDVDPSHHGDVNVDHPPTHGITSIGAGMADARVLLTSFLLCCGGVGRGTRTLHLDFNVEQTFWKNLNSRNSR